MSKLYTEEQVTNLTEAAFMAGQNHNPFIFQIELNKLTPIELPTDEEIWDESVEIYPYPNPLTVGLEVGTSMKRSYFTVGAKWMRDKIKGGDNE